MLCACRRWQAAWHVAHPSAGAPPAAAHEHMPPSPPARRARSGESTQSRQAAQPQTVGDPARFQGVEIEKPAVAPQAKPSTRSWRRPACSRSPQSDVAAARRLAVPRSELDRRAPPAAAARAVAAAAAAAARVTGPPPSLSGHIVHKPSALAAWLPRRRRRTTSCCWARARFRPSSARATRRAAGRWPLSSSSAATGCACKGCCVACCRARSS